MPMGTISIRSVTQLYVLQSLEKRLTQGNRQGQRTGSDMSKLRWRAPKHDQAELLDATDDFEAEAAAAYGRMIGADLTRTERMDRARSIKARAARSRPCNA